MISKKLELTIISLIIVAVMAVAPVTAASDAFATNISAGDSVYLGESDLKITNILKEGNNTLAWYSAGSNPSTDTPAKTITLTDTELSNFYVDQARFGEHLGPWYAYNLNGTKIEPALAFYVADLSLNMELYQRKGMIPITGKKIISNEYVSIKIDSSFAPLFQRAFTDANLIDGRERFEIVAYNFTTGSRHRWSNVRGHYYKSTYNDALNYAGGPGNETNVSALLHREKVPGINAYAVTPDKAKLTKLIIPNYDDTSFVSPFITSLMRIHPTVSDYFIYPTFTYRDGYVEYTEPQFLINVWGKYLNKEFLDDIPVYPVWRAGIINDEENVLGYKILSGEYEFYAEININGMKDNLGEITGKTVSKTITLTVEKETVKITADKETVIRNNAFSVKLEGTSRFTYLVWFTDLSSYNYDEVPSFIKDQYGANVIEVNYSRAKNTTYKSSGKTIADDLPLGTYVAGEGGHDYTENYAIAVRIPDDSTMTIGIMTTEKTKDTTYTIRAQKTTLYGKGFTLDPQLYDTVKVKVEKGAVTVAASGDGSYYLGEEVTLSGTNTDSDDVFLFITGPNLPVAGGKIDDPKTSPKTKGESTKVTVKSDDTWEYKWDTSGSILDAGTYTIYATSDFALKSGTDKTLSNVEYDTVSVVIKKPFVTATTSASTVAKGDKLYIRGTAEGNPTQGVGVWILGKNYWNGEVIDESGSYELSSMVTETVNDDGSFEHEVDSAQTKNLASGQYFVVVQHPMYNGVFDVKTQYNTKANTVQVTTDPKGTKTSSVNPGDTNQATGIAFIIAGTGKLQGSDAAEALITSINSANVDDTYTKLTFLVEEPWIRVNTVGDHYVGDQFKITGTTNLAVDDTLIVEVTSSSFQPTQKTQSGEFSGLSSTVKVTEGSTYNDWALDVDSATFKADEYIVNVEAIEADVTTTTTFNILSGSTTAASAAQTDAPATAGTTTPTTATTASPTPAATTAPGFGALLALIGLGSVAVLAIKRD